jgi:rhamnose transport system permease protein
VLVGVLFQAGWPLWAAAIVAVVVGAVGGALNGFLVTVVGLPSLAVTVGTLALFRGIAVGLLGTTAVTGFPESYKNLASVRLFGFGTPLPSVILVFVVLAILFIVLLHFTAVGRATYAVGLSDEAATFSGINVGRLKFWFFVATGAVSALAGIFWTLRFDSARGDNATGLELSVVAAVLVGGVSIFGGRGSLPGVIAGVLVIGALRSALRLADISDDVINVAIGLLLVASVLVPRILSGVRGLLGRRRRT